MTVVPHGSPVNSTARGLLIKLWLMLASYVCPASTAVVAVRATLRHSPELKLCRCVQL